MKNKTVIIFMAALLAAGITPAWGALAPKPAANLFAEQDVGGEKITISQAIQMALEDSYQVIDAVKQKEIYERQLSAARAGYYPSLSLDGSYSRAIKKARFAMGSGGMVEVGKNNTYSAGLNLNQTLWAGGQVRNTARLAKVTAEEGAYNLKHVRDLVTKAVVKYCYGIIYASAYIRVQE